MLAPARTITEAEYGIFREGLFNFNSRLVLILPKTAKVIGMSCDNYQMKRETKSEMRVTSRAPHARATHTFQSSVIHVKNHRMFYFR